MTVTSSSEQAVAGVGSRLRALRRRRGITLDELAERTGVSQSTLSRLETGHRRATLELLLPLAEAYGVPLDDLVAAPRTGDPRIHLKPIHRHGMAFIPLTKRAGGIQAYKMVIPAGRPPANPTLKKHEGYEWVYVLEGQLRLILGRDRFVVMPGEAAEFDTAHPHALHSSDGKAVELLILFGVQGERAHLKQV